MSLVKFIEQENRMRSFFNQKLYDVNNITAEDAEVLFRKLDSNLSPEILHADGERPAAQARALGRLYRQAIADLEAKGFAPNGYLYTA